MSGSPEVTDRRARFGARWIASADLDGPVAAVGKNTGNSGEHAYVLGFGYAAKVLLAALMNRRPDEEFIPEDALIYPIAYCTRHFVELFLKDITREIYQLRNDAFPVGQHHDIRKLWIDFQVACSKDRRLDRFPDRLREVVLAIADLDSTGQTFRYRKSSDNDLHLADVSVIAVGEFEMDFRALFKLVSTLYAHLEDLQWEYILGTYTPQLSRSDLVLIAGCIGSAVPAGKVALKEAQTQICTEYALSRSQYKLARQQIEGHYLLSLMAGKERPLKEFTESTLGIVVVAMVQPEVAELLMRAEMAALWGILSAGDAVGDCEYYDPTVQAYLEQRIPTVDSDVVRALRNKPANLRKGLVKLGQRKLVDALDSLIPWTELQQLRAYLRHHP